MKHTSGSKKFAWVLLMVTTALTAYAISQGLEGAGMAMFSSGIMSATALYANKQFQTRKTLEIEKGNN